MITRERSLLIIISGPSGAGKSSLSSYFVDAHDSCRMSLSATTRPPRGDEVDGREYRFLSTEEFLARKEKGEFAEWAVVHGHHYGTPRRFLSECAERGESVVFDIDVQGSMQLRKGYPDAMFIFVLPPTRRALRERLEGRNTDSTEVVETRTKNALEEVSYVRRFDYLITNDNLDQAKADLEAIVRAERLKAGRADWQRFLADE